MPAPNKPEFDRGFREGVKAAISVLEEHPDFPDRPSFWDVLAGLASPMWLAQYWISQFKTTALNHLELLRDGKPTSYRT